MIGAIIMGALVGWIAGKLMNQEGGLLRNIVVGVIGSFVGSLVFGLVGFSAHGLAYGRYQHIRVGPETVVRQVHAVHRSLIPLGLQPVGMHIV